MGTEALIERLADLRDAECRGAPMALLDDFATALKAAEAERVDTKQLLDRACEVNIQIQAERNKAEAEREKLEISRSAWADSARINRLRAEQAEVDLTAARAEIERLHEHLRSIRHEYETSGQLSGAMLSRTTALLGEQGK